MSPPHYANYFHFFNVLVFTFEQICVSVEKTLILIKRRKLKQTLSNVLRGSLNTKKCMYIHMYKNEPRTWTDEVVGTGNRFGIRKSYN